MVVRLRVFHYWFSLCLFLFVCVCLFVGYVDLHVLCMIDVCLLFLCLFVLVWFDVCLSPMMFYLFVFVPPPRLFVDLC